MRRSRNLLLLGGAALALLAAGLLSSCEDGEDEDVAGEVFLIQPETATLTDERPNVELRAIGGKAPLTWTVSDETIGKVVGTGRTVTYVRISNDEDVNLVTVRDDNYWSAEATMVHTRIDELILELCGDSPPPPLSTNGAFLHLCASGGIRPYTWSMQFNDRGDLCTNSVPCGSDGASGFTDLYYIRTSSGDNYVRVTDRALTTVELEVPQP